ncbi:MAG: hydantoinase/oxoprolinase family protein [Actinobacteria bacterium]|nr:hydantoinase/oxoprolinase family protein [Actinomycetota bacterium]
MSTSHADGSLRVGFDVGGTFTDFVLLRPDGTVETEKRLTSATEPVRAIEQGLTALLEKSGVDGGEVEQLIHATTLGSNAVLERKGPRVALLTTMGFRDVLHIQRSMRFRMYDPQIEKAMPLIPRSRIWEVTQRRRADGSSVVELDEEQVRRIARELREGEFDSVAVAYIHGYAEPVDEQRTRELLLEEHPDLLVTISSEVSQQGREYERTNTTVVNAYLSPVLGAYVRTLTSTLPKIGFEAPLWMMQSSGGVTPAEQVVTWPVRTIESGPAAGALTAAFHGGQAGHSEVISFDMGGTTAKAAVIRDGRPTISRFFELEREEGVRKGSGLPLDIPAIELVEIGTGGGSIAKAQLGVLKVGPESASSEPGPACYGRGGTSPTVTDANLVLGYLNPDYFAGGSLELKPELAEAAIDGLAQELGLERIRVAWGIHELATLEMERALRLVSIDRGLDPRDFAMVCSGGAGPAHASRLGRSLGIKRVIVPQGAGVGSARGLLEGNQSVELARTAIFSLDDGDAAERAASIFATLEQEARALVAGVWDEAGLSVIRGVGMRYAGQGYELEVPIEGAADDLDGMREAFFDLYARTYGYKDELPVEAVTWYLSLLRRRADADGAAAAADPAAGEPPLKSRRDAYFPEGGLVETPVYGRPELVPGQRISGPALIEEEHTTTVVLPDDEVSIDRHGSIIITNGGSDGA